MASELSISNIISIARICQYLQVVQIGKDNALKGGAVDNKIARLIFMVRKSVETRYNQNSADLTLRSTANYLFSLLKLASKAQLIIGNLAQSPPVITGPSNQSVNVGSNATFSVSVVSSLPVTYQWFENGVLIPGATNSSYTKTNAQLADSGDVYTITATNAAGSTGSNPGLLTVTASIQANWWYGDIDPYPALSGGTDNLSYQVTQNIIHNDPIAILYPVPSENNKFNVLRYPISENDKTSWQNTILNNGFIPDIIMRSIITIGSYKYIISRSAMSLDAAATNLTYS